TILILLCPVFLFSTAAASEFYTLSLHDALPIYTSRSALLITRSGFRGWGGAWIPRTGETATWPTPAMWSRQRGWPTRWPGSLNRSEEHTSELQSRGHLVCRLLLEKKKATIKSYL